MIFIVLFYIVQIIFGAIVYFERNQMDAYGTVSIILIKIFIKDGNSVFIKNDEGELEEYKRLTFEFTSFLDNERYFHNFVGDIYSLHKRSFYKVNNKEEFEAKVVCYIRNNKVVSIYKNDCSDEPFYEILEFDLDFFDRYTERYIVHEGE